MVITWKSQNDLAGQFLMLFLLFARSSHHHNVQSSQDFENLSITEKFQVRSYRFLRYTPKR